MLVLARKEQESICIGDSIVVTVVRIGRGRVQLGIEAPSHVSIRRQELPVAQRPLGLAVANRPTSTADLAAAP